MDDLTGVDATNADVRDDVQERYGAGAQAVEAALCCPIDYDPQYLKIIPQDVLDRDYGCGDPSRYVREVKPFLIWAQEAAKFASLLLKLWALKVKLLAWI